MSIVSKAKREIDELLEKVTVEPDTSDDVVKLKVDDSDDRNVSYKESATGFSLKPDLKIEVEIEEDKDEKIDSYLKSIKESSDTVFGQGTPPNPEDETYLSLLKKSVKPRVKIKTEEDEEKSVIKVDITKDDKKADPNARPSMY